MSNIDYQIKNVSQHNIREGHRIDLTFLNLGNILMEIANQTESQPIDNQFSSQDRPKILHKPKKHPNRMG
jgi:hypothetical protein